MKNLLLLFTFSLLFFSAIETQAQASTSKIKVLNFATFHMGTSSDANSVEFDEEDEKNQADAQQIAEMIAKFQPTVICVEVVPEDRVELNEKYQEYVGNPAKKSTYYGEVGLVAFEVGRLSEVKQLHAIDHKMEYDYNINETIKNELDPLTYDAFAANPIASVADLNIFDESLPLLDRLKNLNNPRVLDLLIMVNADMLTFVGTKNGFEGADEAAKYYKRNLRIYANLNRIPLTTEDRVFILSGGSHTAFLNEFMKRSPKYEVVNTMDYLK